MILEILMAVIIISSALMLTATLERICKELRRIRKQQDSFFENYFETHFWKDAD